MDIVHIALGGLVKSPPVAYGRTEDTGGHIAYVLGAARAQAALGARVRIVTRRFDAPDLGACHAEPREAVCPGCEVVRLSTASPRYLDKEDLAAEIGPFAEALVAHLEAEPADVLHAHFADAAEAALLARDRLGARVIYTAHSLALEKAPAVPGPHLAARIARETRALAEADAVVASSRDEAERQIPRHPGARQGRVRKIMPGVERLPAAPDLAAAERLLAPFLREPGRPLILAVARPVEKKNLPRLVEIHAEAGLFDRADLAIVAGLREDADGDDEAGRVHRALLAAVDRHGLWGRVALPKRHAPGDVPALLTLAARSGGVFCNPATHEPFGLTLLEAARAGLPVVATANGGPRDIVGEIGHGVVADPGTPAFGGAVARLLDDQDAWDRAHRAALAAAPRLDWSRHAEASLALYRSLLHPHRAPGRADGLLVSDIDATLTGSPAAAARFADWAHGRDRLYAVATGRSITEARWVLHEWGLPEPDAFATSTGSEVYLRGPDGQPELDRDWVAHVSPGWEPERLRAVLDALPGLTPQRDVEFRALKLAYLVDRPGRADEARRAIRAVGCEAHVIFSHGEHLDVLPARAGKAAAMRWLARRLGVPPGRVVAAGDSGNDLDMLLDAPLAVVVGASAELALVRGRPNTHLARAAHADGVLEGLAYADRLDRAAS